MAEFWWVFALVSALVVAYFLVPQPQRRYFWVGVGAAAMFVVAVVHRALSTSPQHVSPTLVNEAQLVDEITEDIEEELEVIDVQIDEVENEVLEAPPVVERDPSLDAFVRDLHEL